LPSIYGAKEYVDFEGLIAYGASDPHMYRRAATFVDKIFKGTDAGTIPVVTPDSVFSINYKVAQRLGLTVGENLLSTADVIVH